jgi:DNA mismatch repair protein MutS
VVSVIGKSIDSDAPSFLHQGMVIAPGYSAELDELRSIASGGKEYIAQIQKAEQDATGISTLKVKFNKVFGYYIEVSKAHASKVPASYERKQTLVNAERFSTPELKEYEHKVLVAEDQILELETKIFEDIRQNVLTYTSKIFSVAQIIAEIDVYTSHAYTAFHKKYTCPQIHEGYDMEIQGGRHPVIENMLGSGQYIPNDGRFNESDHQLLLLTGPNMAGKSSYLRQTALIVLMAQIGAYVPARQASIGLVDRIFTRVGASDNLAGGQSIFIQLQKRV